MICPFRLDVEFEYVALPCKKDEEPSYLEKAQRQVYPPCMEDECPWFDSYYNKCTRIGEE